MNPHRDFAGHEPDYRHFRTDRHSGLMPHHFEKKRRYDPAMILVGVCVLLGCAALAVFALQVLR